MAATTAAVRAGRVPVRDRYVDPELDSDEYAARLAWYDAHEKTALRAGRAWARKYGLFENLCEEADQRARLACWEAAAGVDRSVMSRQQYAYLYQIVRGRLAEWLRQDNGLVTLSRPAYKQVQAGTRKRAHVYRFGEYRRSNGLLDTSGDEQEPTQHIARLGRDDPETDLLRRDAFDYWTRGQPCEIRDMLWAYFGKNQTLKQIAAGYDLCESRISLLFKEALQQLRAMPRTKALGEVRGDVPLLGVRQPRQRRARLCDL